MTRRCPEQALFQGVLIQALRDATGTAPRDGNEYLWRSQADHFIRSQCRDFHTICALAGIAPDAVHDAYVSGRINTEALRFKGAEGVTR